jgi:AcrR family transcriptional regulator
MFNFAIELTKTIMQDFNDKQISILLVAEKLFANNGFDGTSIREISTAANVNVAMVSYYFGSKEKLLESLIVYKTRDLKIKLEKLFKEDLHPIKKIEKFIEFYIEKIDQHRDMHHILQFEITSKKRAMDFESFTEVKKSNLCSLQKIISEGQSQGVFRKDINVNLITPTILGTYFYFQMNKPFFSETLALDTEEKHDNYIKDQLTKHIQQTIKSLLLYEN